jgi:hypothetical protein
VQSGTLAASKTVSDVMVTACQQRGDNLRLVYFGVGKDRAGGTWRSAENGLSSHCKSI